MLTLQSIAQALGGRVAGKEVLARRRDTPAAIGEPLSALFLGHRTVC